MGYLRDAICDLYFWCGFLNYKIVVFFVKLSFRSINVLFIMSTQIQYILYCLLYFLNRDYSTICCLGWGQNGEECTVGEYWCYLLMYFNKKNGTLLFYLWHKRLASSGPVDVSSFKLGFHVLLCVKCLFVFSALCEGERACLQDEVCVYPGLCRCKPGFYGYKCKTRE